MGVWGGGGGGVVWGVFERHEEESDVGVCVCGGGGEGGLGWAVIRGGMCIVKLQYKAHNQFTHPACKTVINHTKQMLPT